MQRGFLGVALICLGSSDHSCFFIDMADATLKNTVFALVPALVFVPLFVGFRLISDGVPEWMYWLLLIGSAGLTVFNPWVVNCTSVLKRAILFFAGFFGWGLLLFFLSFIIMAVIFGEGL